MHGCLNRQIRISLGTDDRTDRAIKKGMVISMTTDEMLIILANFYTIEFTHLELLRQGRCDTYA